MIIRRLIVRDFRNLRSCDLEPAPGINILSGENGQGKTNFLEAIHLLSNLTPIRPAPIRDLIRFGAERAAIRARVRTGESAADLSLLLRDGSKAVKVNGKSVARGVDYFGELAVMLFSPDSLGLAAGGPDQRRRFLDRALSRLDRRYLLDLKEYGRILEQRNRLLRRIREGRTAGGALEIWNEQFASSSTRIVGRRIRYLEELAPICSELFGELFRKKERLTLRYASSMPARFRGGAPAREPGELHRRFLEGIALLKARERDRGATQLGPHLDDLRLQLGGRGLRAFSSQGEKRLAALALILGEALLYREKQGLFPVLLLDDMDSELDPGHRRVLMDRLRNLGQVFLTTTRPAQGPPRTAGVTLFRVHGGEIFLVNHKAKR